MTNLLVWSNPGGERSKPRHPDILDCLRDVDLLTELRSPKTTGSRIGARTNQQKIESTKLRYEWPLTGRPAKVTLSLRRLRLDGGTAVCALERTVAIEKVAQLPRTLGAVKIHYGRGVGPGSLTIDTEDETVDQLPDKSKVVEFCHGLLAKWHAGQAPTIEPQTIRATLQRFLTLRGAVLIDRGKGLYVLDGSHLSDYVALVRVFGWSPHYLNLADDHGHNDRIIFEARERNLQEGRTR